MFPLKNNLKIVHRATRSIICQCVFSFSEKVQLNSNKKFNRDWVAKFGISVAPTRINLNLKLLQFQPYLQVLDYWKGPRIFPFRFYNFKELSTQAVSFNSSISQKEFCKPSPPSPSHRPPKTLLLNCICQMKMVNHHKISKFGVLLLATLNPVSV